MKPYTILEKVGDTLGLRPRWLRACVCGGDVHWHKGKPGRPHTDDQDEPGMARCDRCSFATTDITVRDWSMEKFHTAVCDTSQARIVILDAYIRIFDLLDRYEF